MKFLLASLKTPNNSKNCSESRIKFLFRLSFAVISRFFPVYIHSWLSEQFSGSQAGYGKTFRDTAAIRKSEQALCEGLQEGISELVSDFIEAVRNFIFDFFHKKTTKNCENQKRSFKKYCFNF